MVNKEDNLRTIGTKVTPETYKALKNLAAKLNCKLYNLLQMVCDVFVRYMSDKTNLTPNMSRIMNIFEHCQGWDNAFNLCEGASEAEIIEATYYIGDTRKKGLRAVHVTRPYMGKWQQNQNILQIFERQLELIFPDRYKHLRLLAIDNGCNSIWGFIDQLIDEYCEAEDTSHIRAQFEDCRRSDFGTKPTDAQYKRKMHRDIEGRQFQHEIIFDETDQELANDEAEDY